jgi:hypothetical protein
MTEMLKKMFPQFWYEEMNQMKEYDSPQADMVDAFWMAYVLLKHMEYEVNGRDTMDAQTVSLLEHTTNSKTKCIIEHKLVKSYIFSVMSKICEQMDIVELKEKQLQIMKDKTITDDEKLRLINEIGKQIASYD